MKCVIRKILYGRFIYYLEYMSVDKYPIWNGLKTNARWYPKERAISILEQLRISYPHDTFDYTIL